MPESASFRSVRQRVQYEPALSEMLRIEEGLETRLMGSSYFWVKRFSNGPLEVRRVVGRSEHQGAWSFYSSAKDGNAWRPLQALGCAFEDPEEAKAFMDRAMAEQGFTAEGDWVKEAAQGPFED